VNNGETRRKEFNAPDARFTLATIAFGGWDLKGPGLTVANAHLAVDGDKGKYPGFKGNVKTVEARGFWRDKSVSPSGAGYHYNTMPRPTWKSATRWAGPWRSCSKARDPTRPLQPRRAAIERRTMQTRLVAAGLILGMMSAACAATPAINKNRLPDEVRAEEVRNMRWGMFICWSFSTFSGREWTPTRDKDASCFKATGCDTDQWCRTAKDAGMGYILFLAKHHDGFCLWDTKTTDKKVTNSPIGIDVLAQLRKSCDRYGIKLALYFSEGDWNWPGAVDGKRQGGNNPEVKKAQLRELLTGYGPIEFWWMDHAVGTGGLPHQETVAWMHRFQPNTFVGFNHGEPAGRLCLRERGRPGRLGDKDASEYNKGAEASFKGYRVAEFTYPILPPHKGGAQWFYSLPRHDNLCHPASKVYKDYQGAMEHGNIFSINIGPNYAGRIRDIDVRTLEEVGKMIRAGSARRPPERPSEK